MALISMYVPVLGAFVNFVWPLPIVICGCRHGLKWSVMTLLVATIIVAMIISPINAKKQRIYASKRSCRKKYSSPL